MPLLLISAALIIYGLLAIFSVSIHESFTLTLDLIRQGNWDGEPSNYFYFSRQIRNLVVAIGMAWIAYFFPLKRLRNHKVVIWLFLLVFLFQLAVFLPEPIGATFNGARWWVRIAWSFTLQPAEFFKIWYVIFLSWWFIRKKNKMNTKEFFVSFAILHVLLLFVFLLIPDLGTILVLWSTWLIMCWFAWAKSKSIVTLLVIGAASAMVVGLLASVTTSKFDYIQERMAYFLGFSEDEENRDIGRQNQQALIAIWWWWLMGNGYWKWLQKLWYIPEAQSDFIFSAFSEEVWFIGNVFLLWLYFFFAYFALIKLTKVKSFYFKIVAAWLLSLIIVQVGINLWVNLKLLPNTWLTLPFVSFWWTALMVNLIEVVLLYKILYKEDI